MKIKIKKDCQKKVYNLSDYDMVHGYLKTLDNKEENFIILIPYTKLDIALLFIDSEEQPIVLDTTAAWTFGDLLKEYYDTNQYCIEGTEKNSQLNLVITDK